MDAHSIDCLNLQRICELLAAYTHTALGKGLALGIRPAIKPRMVQRWLAQVAEMERADAAIGLPPFGGITDVRDLVRKSAPPLRLTVADMADIGSTLAGTHAIGDHMNRLPDESPELRVLAGRIGDYQNIAERISQVIDERGGVRDSASSKLKRIRGEIESASHAIQQAVDRLLRDPSVVRLLQYRNATYHNDRIVLPVRAECRGRVAGIIHRSSDSGATVYVEPAAAVELNNQISRLRADEDEEIARLLWELAHEIHINEVEILKTLDALAVLDLITAKERFAKAFGMICPKLNDDCRLNVRGARHPLLLDLAVQKKQAGRNADDIVPIDYRLGDDFNMLLVTGPNTGGKTVALKTIGLLSLMVQSGLPVPVSAGSEFGLFSDIMIDVGDEQSMEQSLSTFSGHLRRLMEMLERANSRTLLLIDELGAGTDPDEGAAIGRAVLDELSQREARCIVTTHLGALKGYALSRSGVENACVEFDIETFKPTYVLRIGEPGNSNAIAIAERLGMPRRLIQAARRNLSRKYRAMKAAIDGTVESKRKAEHARAAADAARQAAENARSQADTARADWQRQRADFHEWVRHVVHLQPGDAVRVRNFDRDGHIVRMQIEQQRAEVDVGPFSVEVPLGDVLPPQAPPPPERLPRPPKPAARSALPKRGEAGPLTKPRRTPRRPDDRSADSRRHKPATPSLTREQAEALQPGDAVYAKRFHRTGKIVRVKKGKQLAIVSVGALELELPFDGLAMPHGPG